MSTVYTEYGPGRIIAQETVRGRTRFKVAGEGFEVWVDQTKLGGYERPEVVDFNAPHWDGYRDTDPAPGGDAGLVGGDDYGDDFNYDRARLRRRITPRYEEDDPAKYSARTAGAELGGGDVWHDYGAEDGYYQDDPHELEDYDELRELRRLRREEHPEVYPELDDPARYSSRHEATSVSEWAEKHLHDILHDDPYAQDEHDYIGEGHGYGLGEHLDRYHPGEQGSYDDDPDARFAKRVNPGKAGRPSHLAWAPLDDDNSTELPYNPEPQHHAIGTPGDDGSSTIQPTHHIDADERLSPADSITFDEESDEDGPGPNPDLFAKEGAIPSPNLLKKVFPSVEKIHDMTRNKIKDLAEEKLKSRDLAERAVNAFDGGWEGASVTAPIAGGEYAVRRGLDYLSPGAGWGELIKPASRHEAGPEMLIPLALEALPAVARAAGGMAARGLVGEAADQVGDFEPGEGWGDLVKPAGLSDKYIDITAGADYHNDPVAQFRHDPDAYINRIGHLMDEGLNPRFAEYMDLVEADGSVRTAAWKDVRAKAMRLKREGHVTVKDIAPNRIMASVEGDHGTYDVLILKNGSYGGLSEGNPGHAISNWHCGCEWGKWAFRRKFTYVGRLCSHAYASYLTMQSEHMKGKPRQQKGPQRKKPTRGMPFPTRNMRHADALQNGPKRLTPDMVVNDTDDAHMFLDVTKDERDDVGPDDVVSDKDIVHFARIMRECEVTERPYPRELVAFLARYAGCTDDAGDDVPSDYEAHDADDADEYLDQIRSDADRKQEDDFGNMAERVHRVQDAVEEARAHGVDADRFVARVLTAAPDDPENPVPLPQLPEMPPGMVIRQSPAVSSPSTVQDTINNNRAEDSNPDGTPITGPIPGGPVPDASAGAGETSYASGKNGPGESSYASGKAVAGGDNGPGQTKGLVSDGGKAGAENGNNAAITGDSLEDGYYTVGKGDTLTDIAQRAYGDMNKYQDIANANKSTITNVDQLAEGTKIKIDSPTGNNNVGGNLTNPAGGGSDKNLATPDVDVNAVGASSYSNGKSNPTDAAAKPASTTQVDTTKSFSDNITPAKKMVESKRRRVRRRTADSDPQTGTDTESTATSPDSAAAPGTATKPSPGAKPATNPATGQPSSAGATSPKTIMPNPDTETYDPNKPNQQVQQQSSPANPGVNAGGSNQFSDAGSMIGQGVGAATDIASGIGSAIPSMVDAAGAAMPAIGNALSGIASGLGFLGAKDSSIFANRQDFDEWVRYAYPEAGKSGDLEPHDHPFAGSGYPGSLEIGTSEEYADKARKKHDDVTDLGDDPLSTPMGKWQRQSRRDESDYEEHERNSERDRMSRPDRAVYDDDDDPYREASVGYSTDDDSDIVRAFQANLGDTALSMNASVAAGRFDDIAGAAQGFLRTAGRNYSLAEQSELIREGDKGGARNLDSLDLRGTHYEDMDSLGW